MRGGGLALICAALSAPAAAQQPAPTDATNDPAGAASAAADPVELDRIVVTGRAGAGSRSRAETSYAITTIDEEQLQMDAPRGVADALKSVPGFWVESSGGEGSANIRARGIPQEGFSAVGMQEDGLPLQHDPGLGWLNADQSFRLDETVERIEVVRGGPASMFSSNAPGGVVNFITRRRGEVPEGRLKLETSDYGLRRVDGWYGAPLGDWRFGVGGFWREDDGIRDPGFTANEGGQLRVSLGRDFEGGSIDFNVKHIDDNVVFYTGIPLTHDADGDIVGVPGVDAGDGTLAGPETAHVLLRNAGGETRPRSRSPRRSSSSRPATNIPPARCSSTPPPSIPPSTASDSASWCSTRPPAATSRARSIPTRRRWAWSWRACGTRSTGSTSASARPGSGRSSVTSASSRPSSTVKR